MLTWGPRLDQPIISLLEEKDKIAGLIFVHWGVALHLIPYWYARDAGAQIVRALLSSLECSDESSLIDPALDSAQGEFARVVEWASRAVETL